MSEDQILLLVAAALGAAARCGASIRQVVTLA